jgi:hypothetical protein
MTQTALAFAGLALAVTVSAQDAGKPTTYAPPLTICKRRSAA